MANSTLTNLFVDIADAIREKNGTSESIPALEFPDRIREISGGGGSGGGGSGGGSAFEDSATGWIPDCDHGRGIAELTNVFATSATGALE